MSEFQPLDPAFDGHYEKKLAELPINLRLLLSRSFVFFGPTGGPGPITPILASTPGVGRRQVLVSPPWDDLTAEQRRSLVKQRDVQANPNLSSQHAETAFTEGFKEKSGSVQATQVEPAARERSAVRVPTAPDRRELGQRPVYEKAAPTNATLDIRLHLDGVLVTPQPAAQAVASGGNRAINDDVLVNEVRALKAEGKAKSYLDASNLIDADRILGGGSLESKRKRIAKKAREADAKS